MNEILCYVMLCLFAFLGNLVSESWELRIGDWELRIENKKISLLFVFCVFRVVFF